MFHDIYKIFYSFNELEFVTPTQNLNESDAIGKCIHLMSKKAHINV